VAVHAPGPRTGAASALADVRHVPFWLDRPGPAAAPALAVDTTADLLVVGAGYTGLWTALLAKERDPRRDVVLLEARTAGWAASGRNGGFCSASLTHGLRNGLDRFADEMPTLERLGRENLDGIEKAVADHGIDCSWERTGELTVATAPWQVDGLRELPELARGVGSDLAWLDRDEVRDRVDSPTYLGGVLDAEGVAMVDPARLADGLREASPLADQLEIHFSWDAGPIATTIELEKKALPHGESHYVINRLITDPLAADGWHIKPQASAP
jgi:hypothetical protein